MEVHHHAHTERKTFRHYLTEFSMLFLAVSCSFLAEYYLEYRIERHREHEYIDSMISDLKGDTAQIHGVYDFNKVQAASLDTLVTLLFAASDQPDSVKKAYRLYYNYALNYANVVFSDRTMAQLKNSGGLRLIRNQNVSDSIMTYDAGVHMCTEQFDVIKESWTSQSNESYQLFDLSNLYRADSLNSAAAVFHFLTPDKTARRAYANRLIIYAGLLKSYARIIKMQKATATRLIAYLKQAYDIE